MFQYVLLDNSMQVSNTNTRLFIKQVNDTGIEGRKDGRKEILLELDTTCLYNQLLGV